jgi:peptidoglycan/xylan/chitin deacetylase (PgdA/CDA1 family)
MLGGVAKASMKLAKVIFSQTALVGLAILVLVFLCADTFQTAQPAKSSAHKQSLPLTLAVQKKALKPVATPNFSSPATEETPWPQPAPVWQGQPPTPAPPTASAPVIYKISTTQPVVFLTIDDGFIKSPEVQDWLMQHKLPFTLFLMNEAIKDNYEYFGTLQSFGMTIEDHTLTHPHLASLTLEQQKAEICGAADTYQSVYGLRPTLVRPPYGEFNTETLQAAAECGMRAIIMWHAKVNGGSMQFQDTNQRLQPGDVVLMHFRPEFMQDMQAFMDQVAKDKLQIGHLEDWLQ